MQSSRERWAGQVLIAGFPGQSAPQTLVRAIEAGGLGGVILFRRNFEGPLEAGALATSLAARAPADSPLLVGVDQEGGRVARLGAPVAKLPPMRQLARLEDPDLIRDAARALGHQLRALGFSMDFAPVLDVDSNPDNPVIGDRSFGRDPATVALFGRAFAEGLHEAGIASCGKHFPGHGDTDLDSHLALPRVTHPRERLDAVELSPFREALTAMPAVMTAHVLFDALDLDVPATMSAPIIEGILRGELGYRGVVISDDLEMRAVSEHWGVVDAGVAAIEAGCDALLVCSDVDALFALRKALVARAGASPTFASRLEEAAQRTLALRRAFPPRRRVDEAALHHPDARAIEARIARAIEALGE